MNRRAVIVGAIVTLVAVVVWYLMIFSPKGKDISEVEDETEGLRRQQQGLEAELAQLEEIEKNGPEVEAELARLADAVPATPDLASFILGANEIAVESGITWLSVAPVEPAAAVGTYATVTMTIQIEGGFFQVLDYLNRLEDLERLVVVDSIDIGTGTEAGEGTTATTSEFDGFDDFDTGGAPDLSVTLSARMFTLATGGTATTASGETPQGGGGATTPTTTTETTAVGGTADTTEVTS